MSSKNNLENEKSKLIELLKEHNIYNEIDMGKLFTTFDIYTEELRTQNEELIRKEQILLESQKT